MKRKITVQDLRNAGACGAARGFFRYYFPDGVYLAGKHLKRAKHKFLTLSRRRDWLLWARSSDLLSYNQKQVYWNLPILTTSQSFDAFVKAYRSKP